jgi:hypothetical protein
VTQYGIRDKGGSVLVNVQSTTGVEFVANGQSGRGTAEVSEVNANGIGQVIIDDTNGTVNTQDDDELILSTTGEALDVTFGGNAVTDVFEIVGGNFSSIVNDTRGEIVNVDAGSIGEIVANTLGLSKSTVGSIVAGNTILNIPVAQVGPLDDAGPFSQQRNAIRVSGDIVSARSLQGLGNFIVQGSIQELIANADGVGTPGVHEGINGPIMTQPGGVASAGGGEMRYVNIGEGLLPSGTGEVLFSGLFAHSRIRLIENQGEGSDIRGDIVSKAQNLPTQRVTQNDGTFLLQPVAAIGTISLGDGSILGSDILVVQRFQNAREINGGAITTPNDNQPNTLAAPEIGTIGLSGKGGIMSASVRAADIGRVIVDGGFGIFNSFFGSTAQGDMDTIVTDGFGIRTAVFAGGGAIKTLQARGTGSRPSVTDYSASVRYSERMQFDPYSGFVLSALNDLHLYMGTTKDAPKRLKGDFGRSGLIYDTRATGARTLSNAVAYQFKSTLLSFASGIGRVTSTDTMDALLLTAGRLETVNAGNDVHNAEWNIAGPVGSVYVNGTWRGTSVLSASGPNGQVGSFQTKRSMFGALVSTNDIAQLQVGTFFGAPGTFREEDGSKLTAGVDVGRDLKSFVVGDSILDGATVFVNRQLGFLGVGGNIEEGATLSTKTLASQDIGGEVFGDVEIRG